MEAWVHVKSTSLSEEYPVEESTALGYTRHNGRFRIVVNIGIDPEWRRDVLPVLVRRTVLRAVGLAPGRVE